ncbi:phage tail tube protein [Enterovirga aerilata]|uniref:Phage tail protein n=1 Tax=Enterovirga aerilata TaxID=2730920 RepID=A0A849ICC7_9HYPH|nr:phage tail tube protein [Enterovirga sp. DB1703]NNM75058.1 hypothetical protein [Enterovirga sp. DB1703]
MAQATTRSFAGYKILLEDATSPATYVAPCGFTERSVRFTKEVNDVNVPSCDDEDAASWVERDIVSKSVTVSGNGVMSLEAEPRWLAVWQSDLPFNVRIEKSGNLAAGGGYWLGKFHLTSMEEGAVKGNRVTKSIEMVSTGAVVWTPASS